MQNPLLFSSIKQILKKKRIQNLKSKDKKDTVSLWTVMKSIEVNEMKAVAWFRGHWAEFPCHISNY